MVCLDVVTRYVFDASSIAIQELEWHIFSVIFLLGAAYTLKHDRHVRVDVFYHNFSEINKARVNFFGHLLSLIPFAILVIWSSQDFVVNSFNAGEVSGDPGGLPFRYAIKACIPLGFLLILLQSVSLLYKSFQTMRSVK
jgi:TRAP-type mannitol/chloroaromatic compound transport system permease small subunit